MTRVGQANFFLSSQIANPHTLGLITLLQIRMFLRCASPQITNPKICMLIREKIANPITTKNNTAHICHKTVLKKFVVLNVVFTFAYELHICESFSTLG
jgi:hypothetical protein